MKKTISLFILLSVLGCNNDEAEKAVGDPVKYLQREEVRLSQTGAFSVPCAFSNVDDLRDLGVYTDTEGREIFYLCDDASMAKAVKVYFFDWQTKEPLDTLVLPSEGPYQISEGARIYNLGVSVFENELVAWDALAGKFLRYSLENKRKAAEVFYWSTDNSKLYKPVIACRFPLTKFDQDRYILPIGMGVYNFVGSNVRTDLSSILKIKLTKPNKEVIEEQGILPFPPIYEKGFFTLAPQLYASSYVIDGDNLLASFPLDSKIYIK